MSKIVIEIEDLDNGSVKVKSTPSFSEIWTKLQFDPNHAVSYHYSYRALRSIYETSKDLDAIVKTMPLRQ
ncbi:unnamed protein product [marine sediment metagenome]|uniref:Uncharacterized protein n=1 Tax=marine sediment metagenome TaxID=412755 RepID=X1C2N5_9ZZZZ